MPNDPFGEEPTESFTKEPLAKQTSADEPFCELPRSNRAPPPSAIDPPPPLEVRLSFNLTAFAGVAAFTVFLCAVAIPSMERSNSLLIVESIACYCTGAVFSTGMLAVIWPALGSGLARFRFAFAALLLVGIYLLFFLAMGIVSRGAGPPPEAYLGMAVAILCAWAFPLAPLWCLRKFGGVRFESPEETDRAKEKQFSIGHLLVTTGAVALFLGVLRVALIQLEFNALRDLSQLILFALFVGAAFFVCFAVYVAAMLPRRVPLAIGAVLLLTCVASYFELELISLIERNNGGFGRYFFVGLNGASALWSIVFATTIRAHGFRLVWGG